VPVDPKSDSLLESLEANHEFPGEYTFKAIGSNPESFAQSVLSAIAAELNLSNDPPHSVKHTPNGRHVSVTLTLTMETPQHVIKVYGRLQALDDLVMLL
jgi:putative lipoic acid-binding regulatory protein